MIREQELREAIAECQGERNPNANTCIKLAAYYSILDHMEPPAVAGSSFSAAPETTEYVSPEQPADPDVIQWEGESEFAQEVYGQRVDQVMPIVEELMQTIDVLYPRLYDSVIRRIRGED